MFLGKLAYYKTLQIIKLLDYVIVKHNLFELYIETFCNMMVAEDPSQMSDSVVSVTSLIFCFTQMSTVVNGLLQSLKVWWLWCYNSWKKRSGIIMTLRPAAALKMLNFSSESIKNIPTFCSQCTSWSRGDDELCFLLCF